jgi:hypothetical protein
MKHLLISYSIQVGLKTLKENIERQTTLAGHERDELDALQHALGDQNFDFATEEKVNQSIGRLWVELTFQLLRQANVTLQRKNSRNITRIEKMYRGGWRDWDA